MFRPITDSWLLADALRDEPLVSGGSVLDLCTGSGVLAVTAGTCGARRVLAVDVSRRALLCAVLSGAINRARVRARRGDLFAAVAGRRFDVIVCNPPYVPGAAQLPRRGAQRAWEAGPTGRAFLDRICRQAPAHLNPGGVVLLVHSRVCGEERTLAALRAGGLEAEVVRRHSGTLGPRLRERAEWLRRRGMLEGDRDELIVVRGQAQRAGYQPPRQSTLAARRRAAAIFACLRRSSRHWMSEKTMMIVGKKMITRYIA